MTAYHRISIALVLLAGQITAPSVAAPVLINEVLYDGAGADSPDVFTELYGPPGLPLDNWSLAGGNGYNGDIYRVIDLTGAVIPSDGYLVISTENANSLLSAVTDFLANIDWQNGPDSIRLLDDAGMIIDALQYGDAGANNRGEGKPAVDVSPGNSLSRMTTGFDTNDNRNDFLETTTPTPGSAPLVASVPEPYSATLFCLGLGCLMTVRRRG